MHIPVKPSFLKDRLLGSDRADADTLETYSVINFFIGVPLILTLSLMNLNGPILFLKAIGLIFGLFLVFGCGLFIKAIQIDKRVDDIFKDERIHISYDFGFRPEEKDGNNE